MLVLDKIRCSTSLLMPPPYATLQAYDPFLGSKIAIKLLTTAVLAIFPYVSNAEDAIGKELSLSDISQITEDVYAGKASSGGSAKQNKITISIHAPDQSVSSNIYGGYAEAGNVLQNSIEFTENSSIKFQSKNVFAGYLKSDKKTTGLKLNGNTITVGAGATVDLGTNSLFAAYVDVPYSSNVEVSEMDGNSIFINKGATVKGNVIAAAGTSSSFSNNHVTVYGNVTKDVVGVDARYPFQSKVSTAYENISVTVNNATIGGNVYAVQTPKNDLTTSLSNLYVRITNSNISGTVGTYSSKSKPSGTLEFTGVNTVGNIVSSFEKLQLNVSDINANQAVLTGTKKGYGFDLNDKTLVINGLDSVINNGSYRLIDLSDGGVIGFNSNTKIEKDGVFIDRLWQITDDVQDGTWDKGLQIVEGDLMSGDQLISKGENKANDNSKTLSESLLGSFAFINQGAEFIADEGINAMVEVAALDKLSTFGAIHGGSSRYETGSHIDVDGVTLATGVATKWENLTLSAFIEAGWASSDSHVSGTKGNGDHAYYGLGTAVRYSFETPFYVDGSLRLGQASTEFDGRYANATAKYDADSLYGSAHVGLGYLWSLNEKIDLDFYGRYIFTYLRGDKVKLGTPDGEKFDMDNSKSHAFRVGSRLYGTLSENTSWRFGLAYEHVADGDAQSNIIVVGTRTSLDTPSLEGDTGIIEAGLLIRPSTTSPWGANVGIKGYVGDRQGISGNATLTYAF